MTPESIARILENFASGCLGIATGEAVRLFMEWRRTRRLRKAAKAFRKANYAPYEYGIQYKNSRTEQTTDPRPNDMTKMGNPWRGDL